MKDWLEENVGWLLVFIVYAILASAYMFALHNTG